MIRPIRIVRVLWLLSRRPLAAAHHVGLHQRLDIGFVELRSLAKIANFAGNTGQENESDIFTRPDDIKLRIWSQDSD